MSVIFAILAFSGSALSQEKPAAPEIKLIAPLALAREADNQLTLRGAGLDQAELVRLVEPLSAVEVKVAKKEKSGPPNGLNAEKVGDTELTIAFRLPADAPESVSFLVSTPAGETTSPPVTVFARDALLDEKEPNAGFRDAQPLALGQTVRAVVNQPRDVDVYQFHAEAGQTVSIEIRAARENSPLDPLLMLFSEDGQLLTTRDDGDLGADAAITLQAPHTGAHFLTVLDAHDAGSPLHHYLLILRSGG